MSDDPTDPVTEPTGRPADPDANGHPEYNGNPARPDDPRVEVAKIRAHVAKLRHWCQTLLADPATAGVLPDDLAADLRSTAPAMTEDEAMGLFLGLAKGEPVSPDHPAFRPAAGEPPRPEDAVAALAAERERLRQAFFALHDHLHPDLDITEEYLLEQIASGPCYSMEEVLAELEREFGGNP